MTDEEAMEDDEEAMTESSGDSGDWWPSRDGARMTRPGPPTG